MWEIYVPSDSITLFSPSFQSNPIPFFALFSPPLNHFLAASSNSMQRAFIVISLPRRALNNHRITSLLIQSAMDRPSFLQSFCMANLNRDVGAKFSLHCIYSQPVHPSATFLLFQWVDNSIRVIWPSSKPKKLSLLPLSIWVTKFLLHAKQKRRIGTILTRMFLCLSLKSGLSNSKKDFPNSFSHSLTTSSTNWATCGPIEVDRCFANKD